MIILMFKRSLDDAKDDYPDDNHCHWYELTQEKDKTVILNVWNDEPEHMIIDDRFEKIIK